MHQSATHGMQSVERTSEGESRLAVRIYSLAKELKYDSKELVDLCAKAGITGKGSALASLADDEVVRLKEYLANRNRPAERPSSERPLERSTERPVERPIRELTPPKKPAPRPAPLTPLLSPAPVAPAASPVSESPSTSPVLESPPVVAASSGATSSPDRPLVRREDYIGPGGKSAGKPPLLAARERAAEQRRRSPEGGERKPPVQRGPSIRLAAMPTVKQPTRSESKEPAPQKPDLKLPIDVLRTGAPAPRHFQNILRSTKRNAVPTARERARRPALPLWRRLTRPAIATANIGPGGPRARKKERSPRR